MTRYRKMRIFALAAALASISPFGLRQVHAGSLQTCRDLSVPVNRFEWDGKCVDGLADGLGAKIVESPGGMASDGFVAVMTFARGKFIAAAPYMKQYRPRTQAISYWKIIPSTSAQTYFGPISKTDCMADPDCRAVDRYDISRIARTLASRMPKGTSNEMDGFLFKITTRSDGKKVLEASGGPCATADAKVYRTVAGDPVYIKQSVMRGTWESQDYYISAESIYTGIVLLGNMHPGLRYAEVLQHAKKSLDDVLRTSSSSAHQIGLSRQHYAMTECIVRNHRQYVLAYQNWVKTNAAKIR
ncbi:MAG: hypothetical protein WBF84_16585 [Castellaniella sp.]|uniref:Uncharacterized protein n=1 Tax=Castellaniella hirudinis TaxID=1144617 RepID=A0ABV8RZC2_9BURK